GLFSTLLLVLPQPASPSTPASFNATPGSIPAADREICSGFGRPLLYTHPLDSSGSSFFQLPNSCRRCLAVFEKFNDHGLDSPLTLHFTIG
ncbi:hypothetical protein N658DRAFT_564115, partial [Parathielavia hyrcaniae]